MTKIVLVEDELDFASGVEHFLRKHGINIVVFTESYRGLNYILENINSIDLVIIDLHMKDINGFEICEKVREISIVPLIVISSDQNTKSKIQALDNGCDDYLTKPIIPEELLSRINARLRYRQEEPHKSEPLLTFAKESNTFFLEEKKLHLTKLEYHLLLFLYQNSHIISSKEMIIDGIDIEVNKRSIDTIIYNLRQKLQNTKNHEFIKTIYGQGFHFNTK